MPNIPLAVAILTLWPLGHLANYIELEADNDGTSFLQTDVVKAAAAISEAERLRRLHAGAVNADSAAGLGSEFRNIQIRKQYVPVLKQDKVIAYKTSYFGSIYLGTPAKPFTLVFDTGSGHIIVPSTNCESSTCAKHNRYNRTESDSAVDVNTDGHSIGFQANKRDQVTIAFGTGEITGEFVREVACLVPGDCIDLRVIGATEMTDEPFSLFEFDGVLGLGLEALTLDKHFSFFHQWIKQRPASSPYFAAFFSKHDEGESVMTFGGYDPSKASSEIQWVPTIMEDWGYWMVAVKRVSVGDEVIEDCEDGSCKAILDTGTSLLGVPRQMARTLHKHLARAVPLDRPQELDEIDCRDLPGKKMTFELENGLTVSLIEEDYSRPTAFNLTVVNSTEWRLFCRSLLLPVDMEAPVGPKVFLWGEPFLRRYYTVYDWAARRVGFTLAAETPEGAVGLPSVGLPPRGSLLSGAPIKPPSWYREHNVMKGAAVAAMPGN